MTASTLEERARLSAGISNEPIHAAALRALAVSDPRRALVDVGCGRGDLWEYARGRFARYIGVDGVRYEHFPEDGRLIRADLDFGVPLRDATADNIVSVETIEHLENPRAFVRELARIARPGASIVITTPNQLSALSLLTLIARRRFAAFQDVHYPAHRTALLEIDLRRIAAEAGLVDVRIEFSFGGRMPFTARHYPRALARLAPRLLSDTIVLIARKPPAA